MEQVDQFFRYGQGGMDLYPDGAPGRGYLNPIPFFDSQAVTVRLIHICGRLGLQGAVSGNLVQTAVDGSWYT